MRKTRRTEIAFLLALGAIGFGAAPARATTVTPTFTYAWGGMGSALTLDASATALSDVTPGDALATYAWDLDGNGASDLSAGSPVATVPFAGQWSLFGFNGLPDAAAVTLTATTTQGFQDSVTRIIHFTVPNVITDLPSAATVPEPGTMVLLGSGLAILAGTVRRRRKG